MSPKYIETPMFPDLIMHKPDATKEVWLDTTTRILNTVRIWCTDEGALSPVILFIPI